MNINYLYGDTEEKPLDNLVQDGGFATIFKSIGCIGDSLSSGVLNSLTEEGFSGEHHMYEYSWCRFMERTLGNTVQIFSRGGMTAKEFWNTFGTECGVFNAENLCQCYIIALGVNDVYEDYAVGTVEEALVKHLDGKANSFMAYYGNIVKKIKIEQPDAKIFLVTIPREEDESAEALKKRDAIAEEIRIFSSEVKNTYVIDLRKYGPLYDKKFKETFFREHMTAAGYLLTSKMIVSYIDYIIRHNQIDFALSAFIGTPYKY